MTEPDRRNHIFVFIYFILDREGMLIELFFQDLLNYVWPQVKVDNLYIWALYITK